VLSNKGFTLRRVLLAELVLNPKNCRKHEERDLLVLSASLEKYGQVEPLVVQKSTGLVIGGNGRLEAMIGLGWNDCDIAEVECTDEQATALGIVLNRSAELSSWNTEAVEQALRGIQEDDPVLADMFDHLATVLKIVPGVEPEPTPPTVHVCPECGHRWEAKSKESGE
jgi:ParB-like chromosome segregation protein Spo0J